MAKAKKEVSKKFEELMEQQVVKCILDRGSDISYAIEVVTEFWKDWNIYDRKSRPEDMAVFLYTLAARKAVIKIPEYKSFSQTKFKEGQSLASKDNRHGPILGMISNKETWNFSVKINDANVMTTDSVGDARTFTLTDFNGDWYEGWDTLQFMPDAKENDFIKDFAMANEGRITFEHFIHPNRWTSMYGTRYFITKMLIQRLQEESRNYAAQIKRMKEAGIKYPGGGDGTSTAKSYTNSDVDAGKQIKVPAFIAEIDCPPNESEYPLYDDSPENLQKLTRTRNRFTYNVNADLSFMTRITEKAFFDTLDKNGVPKYTPSWMKNLKFVNDYKVPPRGRKEWNRFIIHQPENFKLGFAVRYDVTNKSKRVSEHYEYSGLNKEE